MSYNPNQNKEEDKSMIKDLTEADMIIKDIAEMKRFVQNVEAEKEARIEQVKKQCEEKIGKRREVIEMLESSLMDFCKDKQHEIFNKKNTVKLVYGDLVLKKCPPKLDLVSGTWKDVVSKIEDIGTPDVLNCLKIKTEADKNAIKKLSKDVHAQLGVCVVNDIKYSYKINKG